MKGTKLSSKMTHKHYALVTAHRQFPIDMLRYDSCFPAAEVDARAIERSLNPMADMATVQILVVRFTETAIPSWSYDRWRSFYCDVEEVNEEYRYRRQHS